MNTIIRKALDEALTAQYNDELMGCEDEDYSFSAGFLGDMKNLIRKTDRKLIYYSKYIAAAACAVVAIGCAVLLPNLLRSDIDVEPTKTETTSGIVTELTSDTAPVTSPDNTTTPEFAGDVEAGNTTVPPVTTSDTVSETTPEVTTETTSETTPEVTTETTPDTTTETSPVISETTSDHEQDSAADIDGDIIVEDDDDTEIEDDSEDANVEGDIIADMPDSDDDVAVEDEDDTEVEDDVDLEEDTDVEDDADYDSDDDVVIEDGDDAVIEDADDEEDADVIPPLDEDDTNPSAGPGVDLVTVPGETVSEILGYYYRDDVTADVLDELYITRATKNNIYMDPEFIDTGFLMDYLKANKDAKRVENLSDYDTSTLGCVHITLSDAPKYTDRTFRDTSARNNYEGIFGIEDVDEEDDEDVSDDYMEVFVDIYPNGIISVQGMDICNETAFFVADKALTDALMAELDGIEVKGDNYETLGDLMSAYGLVADGITQGYADIRGIYDITVTNAHIDNASEKTKLVSILNKYESAKVEWKENRAPNYSDVIMKIDIGLTKSKTVLSIRITDGKIWFVGYIGEDWCASIDNNGIKELINAVLLSENLPEADFFTNAYDYITARVDFSYLKTAIHTDVDNGKIVEYVLNDEKLCEELRVMILEAFKNTEYMPFDKTGMSRDIIIDMGDWCFGISETGRIRLGACNFRSSPELYNKILAFIKANVASVSEEDMDFEVEDDVEVSIDWEDGDIAVDD